MRSIFERQGLTIIEVMVAITMLTVGALAVSSAAAALTRLIGSICLIFSSTCPSRARKGFSRKRRASGEQGDASPIGICSCPDGVLTP